MFDGLGGEEGKKNLQAAITITREVGSTLYNAGEYMVRSLPRLERVLGGSLAPARQILRAALLPAVTDTVETLMKQAGSTVLKQLDTTATLALRAIGQQISGKVMPNLTAPAKRPAGPRSQALPSQSPGEGIASIAGAANPDATLPRVEQSGPEKLEFLWEEIGYLGSDNLTPMPAQTGDAEQRRLAGLIAAGLLAPTWVSATGSTGTRPSSATRLGQRGKKPDGDPA